MTHAPTKRAAVAMGSDTRLETGPMIFALTATEHVCVRAWAWHGISQPATVGQRAFRPGVADQDGIL